MLARAVCGESGGTGREFAVAGVCAASGSRGWAIHEALSSMVVAASEFRSECAAVCATDAATAAAAAAAAADADVPATATAAAAIRGNGKAAETECHESADKDWGAGLSVPETRRRSCQVGAVSLTRSDIGDANV